MAKIPSYPGSPQPGVLTVLLPTITFSSVLDEVLRACSDRVDCPKTSPTRVSGTVLAQLLPRWVSEKLLVCLWTHCVGKE